MRVGMCENILENDVASTGGGLGTKPVRDSAFPPEDSSSISYCHFCVFTGVGHAGDVFTREPFGIDPRMPRSPL
jgi:hypothetical protein